MQGCSEGRTLKSVSPPGDFRSQNEKDHRSDRWSEKLQGFCRAVPVNCTQTGWLLAGLMLALRWAFWTLTSGRWPLDTGPVGRWLPSALVTLVLVAFGSGWCEKPLRSTNDNSTGNSTDGPDGQNGSPHEI